MTRVIFASLLALPLFAAPAAHAQEAVPDSENGRYSFNQVPEGLLRLDSRTGHVSLCGKRTAGWACQVVPDERNALETEIGRLQNETASLKSELISRGIALPSGVQSPERPSAKNDELTLKLPSDADLDRAMTFFEKIWRRLIDMVQNMQREMDKKNAEKQKS